MEFDAQKSKALKISLLVLAVIVLLLIGAAMGAGMSHRRGNECGFNRFEQGGRGFMQNNRRGNVNYRMMPAQNAGGNQFYEVTGENQDIPVNAIVSTSTSNTSATSTIKK